MKIYLKLYLKLLLGMGIPFFIVFEAIDLIKYGFPKGLSENLFMGIFMALWMPLIMSLFHIREIKRITSGKYSEEDVLNVHHTRNIELPFPYDKTFDLCVLSLNLIEKRKIQKEARSQGKIEARNGMLLGRNVVSFKISKIDDSRTQVEVSSKPVFRPTLVDKGRNLENVMKIIGFLKKRMI